MLKIYDFEITRNTFQFLNNITHIFTYFFTNMNFQKIQKTLLE